jgi:1,4-alpha-glucan branching enzyme
MLLQLSPIEPIAKRFPALEEQEIVLTFFEPEAREVYVAGNFNDWHTDSTPMTNRGEGEWGVRLMLRSGRYEYRFVVDGRWSEDPRATERVTNPYGDFNSVLVVPLADRTFFL